MIRAALPLLRQQRQGHVIGVSSTLGIIAMPLVGFYSATKWAVEALHESLAAEVQPFGVKVTLVEPGAYATDFGSPASLKQSDAMDIYRPLRQRIMDGLQNHGRGDPRAIAAAMLKLMDAEEPPLRFILGNKNLPAARSAYADRMAIWEAWAGASNAAQGEQLQ